MPRPTCPQGSLPLLILKILNQGKPTHGYGLSVAIERLSAEALSVEEGSLYPALHRLEEAGWIKAQWVKTENNRRARVYEITKAGVRQLAEEEKAWRTATAGVARVLRYA